MTPQFAAPEQLLGKAVTTATDVYSLGLVLYVLLTGRHPILAESDSSAQLIHAVLTEDAPQASTVAGMPTPWRRSLQGDLDNILGKALKKAPAERYASVGAFADDLKRYLTHEPVKACRRYGNVSIDEVRAAASRRCFVGHTDRYWFFAQRPSRPSCRSLKLTASGTPRSSRRATQNRRTSSWISCCSPMEARAKRRSRLPRALSWAPACSSFSITTTRALRGVCWLSSATNIVVKPLRARPLRWIPVRMR